MDAREKLLDTYPDVFEKVKIVGYTDWIPNDTVTFRKDLPPELQGLIVQTLYRYAQSPEGKKVLKTLYDIDGLEYATDEDYEIVRTTLKSMNMDPADLLK
jgi:phosphonate transport system substrate-binding protein